MRAFLKYLARGVLLCAGLLVLSLSVCLAAGLFWIPEAGESDAEIPKVYVIEPKEEEQAGGETQTAENTAEQGTESPAAGKTEGGEGTAASAGADAGADSRTDSGAGPVKMLFAGDLFLTDLLQTKYSQQGISAAASEGLLSALREADIFMLNQEFPFGTTGEAMAEKEYTFRVDPGYISVLSDLSVDIVTLANNHMLDLGRRPLTQTLNTLDGAGIAHVGAGENLEEAKALKTFEVNGRTIGFLGASRVIPEYSWNASSSTSGLFTTYDASALVEQIKKAGESCDFTVVYVHWGVERSTQPEEYQRTLAKQYIDAGADAVIGAHPHVLQGIEYYQGKPVFYSLGNFIFNNGTYESMLVELTFGENGTEIRLIPCVSEANRMRLLEEDETEAFYRNMEGLSSGISIDSGGRVSRQTDADVSGE